MVILADREHSVLRYSIINTMNRKICIVGLGFVGLPLAVAFGKKFKVNAFDIDKKRINELRKKFDRNGEVSPQEIKKAKINFSCHSSIIKKSDFIIVAVPTPVIKKDKPDLSLLVKATQTIGKNLQKNSIVVFESTVYPGATEEVCIPILEKESKLKYKVDFKVGYSPERINPGDKKHTVDKIIKVVSGCDKEALEIISQVYEAVIKPGVLKAKSIKVAEAAKVIENIQRDLNIALMNELQMIFDKLNIKTQDVLAAAKTKWNFLDVHPGLVGGQCIDAASYYLAVKATLAGYHPKLILAGRKINNQMVKWEFGKIIKKMKNEKIPIKGAKILILGATFKPNVKDLRNSKVKDLVNLFKNSGCQVTIYEPMIPEEKKIFSCPNISLEKINWDNYDFIAKAVSHHLFLKISNQRIHYLFE